MLNQCLLYIITVSLSTKKNCLITAGNEMYILENDSIHVNMNVGRIYKKMYPIYNVY